MGFFIHYKLHNVVIVVNVKPSDTDLCNVYATLRLADSNRRWRFSTIIIIIIFAL